MQLSERIKLYESVTDYTLSIKTPVIIRVDGKTFHSLKLNKPFDEWFIETMIGTAFFMMKNIQNAKLAYTQSDEISILLLDTNTIETQPWLGNRLNKLVSISAALASSYFTYQISKNKSKNMRYVQFDSRAFQLPDLEIENYFIHRWRDCVRNSILAVAQSHYSSKVLHGKKQEDMHELLHKININWATDFSGHEKNGTIILPEEVKEAPDSVQNWKELIGQLLLNHFLPTLKEKGEI